MIPYPRFIILMGVTGSGKTTLGKMLAEKLGWDFMMEMIIICLKTFVR